MKTSKALTLVVSALMVSSMLAGCKKKQQTTSESSSTPVSESSSESQSQSESSSSQSDSQAGVVLSAVTQKEEFITFLANRAKPSSEDSGFINNSKNYEVGTDNPFNVKPELTVLDGTTFLPVDPSEWPYDFDISMTMDGGSVKVDNSYFEVVDARNADIQFTDKAANHSFEISVVPTHIDEENVAEWTKKFTVDVVEGYNVYTAKELSYFDTRHGTLDPDNSVLHGDVANMPVLWDEFKTENGLDVTLEPKALLLHNNIKVTTDDIPSNYVYTKAEASALSDAKAEGSLKDRINLYTRSSAQDVTLNGNYFSLNISEIPLVVREEGQTTAVGGVVSHAAIFKIDNATATFENLNITGNAKKATTDEDTIYGGGAILIKGGSMAREIVTDNMNARDTYITFMSEKPTEGYPIMAMNIADTKCSNNYNSFLYNWCGIVNAVNSSFVSCGGPIMIQDHVDYDNVYEENHGMTVRGYAPQTTFTNCRLENYVIGTEAWFIQFNATALMPQVKSMSDLYAASTGKTFITNEAREGKLYQELAAGSKLSLFNFIVLNKSGSAEGITNTPVTGRVTIINGDKTNYLDYRQPAFNPVVQAYQAYQANPSDATQQALIAAGLAAGIAFAPDFSDAETKIAAYIQDVCTTHEILRGLNNNGAPVFDLGNGTPLGTTDGTTPNMLDAAALAASSKVNYSLTTEQAASVEQYTAVYFNGMMLLMQLHDLVM